MMDDSAERSSCYSRKSRLGFGSKKPSQRRSHRTDSPRPPAGSAGPIDDAKLHMREMKRNNGDKYALFRLIGEARRDYYINVYKSAFRSWFTYSITAALLALSVTFLSATAYGICLPPLVVTVFLLYQV